jgi:hypothetical protein
MMTPTIRSEADACTCNAVASMMATTVVGRDTPGKFELVIPILYEDALNTVRLMGVTTQR